MAVHLDVHVRHRPEVDPELLPAVLWNRAFAAAVRATGGSVELGLALSRQDGTVFTHRTRTDAPFPAPVSLKVTSGADV